ncbi:serine/threonine-protein kinase fray2-like [Haliotis asinina]|uniref:serine/threonine-protein kinase fray2-like n=1 Tax=Haliotis asinina TaxID=109174 RepID=UPI0035321924
MDDPWGDDDDDILAQAVDHAEQELFAEDDDDDWLLSQSLADAEEQLQLHTSHSQSSQTDHQHSNKVPQTNSTTPAWSENPFSKESFHISPRHEKGTWGVMHGQQGSSHQHTNKVTTQVSPSSTITSLSKTSTPSSKQPSPPSTSEMRTKSSSPKNVQCKPSSFQRNASGSIEQQHKMQQNEKTSASETYTKKSQQNYEKDIFDKSCGIQGVGSGITKEADTCSQSGVGADISVDVAGGSGVMSGTSGNRNSDKDMEAELQKQKQSLERVKSTLDSELQCSICNELFVQATSLNCAHAFCALCISQWMKTSQNCPMCRTKIISKNRSLVLDSFIDKMCEQLGEDMKEDRKALLEERKNAQAKFDEANRQHSRTSQGQTRTASPTRPQRDNISPVWQLSDYASSSTSFTDSDYSDEYRTRNRNFERRGRDSDSLYSTDSSATDFSDHSPRSRQRRRDMRHWERRRRRQHRRGRHTNSDSSMSSGRREDWRRRRRSEGMRMRRRMRFEQERREQTTEHSNEDSSDSHDEESSHGRDRRHRGQRRRARIESSSEASDFEDNRHATERHTRRRNSQSHHRDRSRSTERSNIRRQSHDRRRNMTSDDEDVDNGWRGSRQHNDLDSSFQSTSTGSSQGSTSSSASIPATSRARPTRSTTSYGVARFPRRTQLINPRSQSRRSFYGGYGKCFKCGRSGHWANGCTYR